MDSWNDKIDKEMKKRMLLGEKKHGRLNLQTDPRDFIQEGIEELIDFLNYLEMAMLQPLFSTLLSVVLVQDEQGGGFETPQLVWCLQLVTNSQ